MVQGSASWLVLLPRDVSVHEGKAMPLQPSRELYGTLVKCEFATMTPTHNSNADKTAFATSAP